MVDRLSHLGRGRQVGSNHKMKVFLAGASLFALLATLYTCGSGLSSCSTALVGFLAIATITVLAVLLPGTLRHFRDVQSATFQEKPRR